MKKKKKKKITRDGEEAPRVVVIGAQMARLMTSKMLICREVWVYLM